MLTVFELVSKEKLDPEHLALLVKLEWQLSYVTPLHRFRHTQLKSYARQLSAFIAAEKLQGLAVEVGGPQNTFKVSLSVLPGLAETDEDPETVLIQVQAGLRRGLFDQFSVMFHHLVSFSFKGTIKTIVCEAG